MWDVEQQIRVTHEPWVAMRSVQICVTSMSPLPRPPWPLEQQKKREKKTRYNWYNKTKLETWTTNLLCFHIESWCQLFSGQLEKRCEMKLQKNPNPSKGGGNRDESNSALDSIPEQENCWEKGTSQNSECQSPIVTQHVQICPRCWLSSKFLLVTGTIKPVHTLMTKIIADRPPN